MASRKHRGPWLARAFWSTGTDVSTLGNIAVAGITGDSTVRGIATINSGTTIASVAAAGVASGNVILTAPIQFTLDASSANFCMVTVARSVRAGAFEIVTAGSVAPAANMPVGWFVIG